MNDTLNLQPKAAAYVAVVSVRQPIGTWDAYPEIGRNLHIFTKLELCTGNDGNLVILLVPVVARHKPVGAGEQIEPMVDVPRCVH